jgi:ribose transport system substrate-binding protein
MLKNSISKLCAATILSAGFAGAAQAEGLTFALVQYNQQVSFFTDITRGAQEAAAASGDELLVFDANNSAQAQDSAFETYIQQGVDGIIIVCIDPNGIMAAVRAADEAGIPVIAVDGILPEGPQAVQIAVDAYNNGKLIGEYFVDYVEANMGGEASVGIMGALNSPLQNDRQRGFEDAIAGVEGIEMVGVVDGRNIQDQALAAGENLLTGNPTMTAIYATGEPALVGAIAATESQGRTADIKLFGWDLSAPAIAAIDSGYLIGVVQQDPFLEGKLAVESLVTIAAGGTVEPLVNVPVTIVDASNVEDFRALFQ